MRPDEVRKYTFSELSDWVTANRKRQLSDYKFLSQVGYAAGLVGSMSLAKSRPTYEELWNFDAKPATDIELSKARMMAWAINVNSDSKKGD